MILSFLVSVFVLFYCTKALKTHIIKRKKDKCDSSTLLQKRKKLPPKGYKNLIKAIQDNNINDVKRYARAKYINRHDTENDYGFTPLMYAIMNNNIESKILSILLSRKANIHDCYEIGDIKHSAFELAILRKNEIAIEKICEYNNISEKIIKEYKEKLGKVYSQNDATSDRRVNLCGYGCEISRMHEISPWYKD